MQDVLETPSTIKSTIIPEAALPLFQGRYHRAIGRRKRSVAEVRLYEGGLGKFFINGKSLEEYLPTFQLLFTVMLPLEVTNLKNHFHVSIRVFGGGIQSQAGSIAMGIARALLKYQPELRKVLKVHGLLTRDPREKERKKPGLKRARRAHQWKKR